LINAQGKVSSMPNKRPIRFFMRASLSRTEARDEGTTKLSLP